MKIGAIVVLYNPNDTTDDKTVVWTSSDESIVKVTEDGKIIDREVTYNEYLGSPLKGKAQNLLHTTYKDKSEILKQ